MKYLIAIILFTPIILLFSLCLIPWAIYAVIKDCHV